MRRGNVVAVVTGVTALCTLAVVPHRPAVLTYTDSSLPDYTYSPPPPPPSESRPEPSGLPTFTPPNGASEYSGQVAVVFQVAALLVLIAAVAWLAVAVVRALRRRRSLQAAAPTLDRPLDEVLSEGVDRALDDVVIGTPDNAIIRCWVALQDSARRAGVEPRASETSKELTVRLLTELDVDTDAVHRLAELYREARFSTHQLGESQRQDALDALTTIRTTLSDRRVTHG